MSGTIIINNSKDINKISYGISEIESIDVTEKIKNYLNSNNNILSTDVDMNKLIGHNPYIGIGKKIYIHVNSDYNPKIIKCANGKLLSNLVIQKVKPDVTICKIKSEQIIKDVPNILIYLVYHDHASYKVIEKYAKYNYVKLFYNATTKYFESNIFNYLAENKNEWIEKDYVGILTYSFRTYIGKDLNEIYLKIIEKIKRNKDLKLISLYGIYIPKQYFIDGHKKLRNIFDHTLPSFNFKIPINYNNITPFYRNYWLTTPELISQYINFALKFMEKLEDKSDIFLQEMINSDAQYNGKLPKRMLERICGFPYYTHHCFVMERLPCIFFWKNNIKPCYL